MISEKKKLKVGNKVELNIEILENGSPYWLIVTHGLGEHCGRHSYMYKLFSQYFNICLYDLRGHGHSTGKRCYTSNFKEYISDLEAVVQFLKSSYSMDNHILFGHSMGALVTASYMQNHVLEENYPQKVFLSGPPVAGAGTIGKIFKIAPLKIIEGLKGLPFSVPLEGMLDLSRLSHDPRVYENYVTDKLNCLKVHSKTFLELLNESRNVFSRPLRIDCPLYCAVGTEDGLVDANSVVEYFQTFEKNCHLKVIEGGYHELHNEIDKYSAPYLEFLRVSIMDAIFEDF